MFLARPVFIIVKGAHSECADNRVLATAFDPARLFKREMPLQILTPINHDPIPYLTCSRIMKEKHLNSILHLFFVFL
jgi:hypothetical protein